MPTLMPFLMPSSPSKPTRYVFVYGTLLEGEERDINRLSPAPRWLGKASVEGVLYDLGAYPGLLLGGEPDTARIRVRGDVYEISAELERHLDEIEGVAPEPNGEYERRQVLVHIETAEPRWLKAEGEPVPPLRCLVYQVTPGRVAGCPVIHRGDWIEFRKAREQRQRS